MRHLEDDTGKMMPSRYQVVFSGLDKHSFSNSLCLKMMKIEKSEYSHSVGNLQAKQVNTAFIMLFLKHMQNHCSITSAHKDVQKEG